MRAKQLTLRQCPDHTLSITDWVHDNAERENAGKCLWAQAVRLFIPSASSIAVTAETLAFNRNGIRFRYTMPAKGAVVAAKFDAGQVGKEIIGTKIKLDGRTAFARPVVLRGPHNKRSHKQHTKPKARSCIRRYHGLRVIESRI